MRTPSLSIIVPVFNQQATLSVRVTQLLEAAEEIAPSFEIVLVDDGSTDHSCEIIADLTIRFPQVRAEYHTRSRGNITVESARRRALGETVVVHDPKVAVDAAMLRHACLQARAGSFQVAKPAEKTSANQRVYEHSEMPALPHAFANRAKRTSRRDVSGICPPRYQV